MGRCVSWSEPLRCCLVAGLTMLLAGCVETALFESQTDLRIHEPWPETPEPIPTEGAIWPGNSPSGSFLFFDQKARGVGDLVTVEVLEDVSAEGAASTDLEQKSTLQAVLTSDVGLQQLVSSPIRLVLRLFGMTDPQNTGPAGTELNVLDAQTDNKFEGEGSTSRQGKFNAVITCRVVEELPGKVFRIRGKRALVINHEIQYLTVDGYVRQQDIAIDNVVLSEALAEARITLDGLGVVDDKQRPGWGSRVFSWIYPF